MAGINPDRQYVIGTAGHIDHGKTALVKALTGVDTDRLPEEKVRGITIDLGFAHLTPNITIIDVPGHERLIKNMVAGVSTIDMVLLTIAADDGIMPQTREHLDIINLLQIHHGIVAITKIDLVEPDWLALVQAEIEEFLKGTNLEGMPIVPTSTVTGEGIEALREQILQMLATIPPKQDLEIFREPVDRVFSLKGFGTIVTGTVLSGKLAVGEEVEIQPGGLRSRVRRLQTHDHDVSEVRVGFRAALNLPNVEPHQVKRGDVLTRPGFYQPVYRMNARLTLLPSSPISLKSNQRVRLHIHTKETFARIVLPENRELLPGESTWVQIRLEEPVHAAYQDRFIIRQYSPQRTIGGGVVLQVNPPRLRRKMLAHFQERCRMLEEGSDEEKILAQFDISDHPSRTLEDLKAGTNLSFEKLEQLLHSQTSRQILWAVKSSQGTLYFLTEHLEAVIAEMESILQDFHQKYPARTGMTESQLFSQLQHLHPREMLEASLQLALEQGKIIQQDGALRWHTFSPQVTDEQSRWIHHIENLYRQAGFAPPFLKEILQEEGLSEKDLKEVMGILKNKKVLIPIDEQILLHKEHYQKLLEEIRKFFKTHRELSVPDFKKLTGTTRKHAIPLLTHLDSEGFTRRQGDVRLPGPLLEEGD